MTRRVCVRASLLACVLFALGNLGGLAENARLPRVAVFRCDVTPPPGEPLIWDTPLVAVNDPLWAKGVVLESGSQRTVLCTFDWCEISNESELSLRKFIAKAARTSASRVLLHCVHQHSAPYADAGAHRLLDAAPNPPLHLSERFLEELSQRLARTVGESLGHLHPFDQVGLGQARVEQVASTRRLRGADGKIVVRYSNGGKDAALAAAPEGDIDPELRTVTLASGMDPLVRLHFYATHPQTFSGDGHASADFVGQAREAMERKEGIPQVYFTGCAGDVTVGKYNDGAARARSELAQRLLSALEASAAATRWSPAGRVQWRALPLKLPLRTDPGFGVADCQARLANPEGNPGSRVYEGAMRLAFAQRIRRPLQVRVLEIGTARMLFLPGEPMLAFQSFAQQCQPNGFVAVAGYCDCGPGYLCTDEAFAEGGYEPTAANTGPGTEARLKEAIRVALGPMSKQKRVPKPASPPLVLACRLSNYQGCEDAAWTHLTSIGLTNVFMSVPAPEQIETTRDRLAGHGLTAVVFRGDADLSQPSGVDRLATQLATCEQMGVKFLFLSVKRRDATPEMVYARLREAGELARRHGVIITLETHPEFGTNGDVQLETMRQVNHPHVRVNFDTGNITFYNRGTDAATELRKIIDYVATVELKDHNGEFGSWHFPALGRGKVDFPAVLKILRDQGYAGPVTLEIEGIQGQPRNRPEIEKEIADSAAYLRSLGRFR